MASLQGRLQVNIDDNVNRLRNHLGRFMAGIPDMEGEMARKFAGDMEDGIKDSVNRKFDRFTGKLHDNVKAREAGASAGGVSYRVNANAYSSEGVNYAAWHEFAETGHDVVVSERNNPIDKWAKQKGIPTGAKIDVTPINQTEGSFMQPGIQKAIKKARRRMRSGNNSVSEGMEDSFK